MPVVFNPFTGNLDLIDNTAAAGSDTQVQFNDGGVLGGDSGLVFNKTTNALTGGAFIPTSSTVPTNGVYLPAANSVALSTSGTGRLFIDASGNVGVGTSSPIHLLDLSNSSNAYVRQTRGSNVFRVGPAGDQASDGVILGTDTNGPLRFFTNGSSNERLSIISNGNVGIGISSPDGRLHVHAGSAGTVTANGNADELVVETNTIGGISILTPDASYGHLMFGSPSDNEGAIIRYRQSDGIYTIGTEIANGSIELRTGNGSTALTIDSSQRVGIGTTGPATAFEVSTTSPVIRSTHSLTDDYLQFFHNGSGAYVDYSADDLIIRSASSTERARIDSSGRLLVGTSSDSGGALLQVNGDRIRVATAKTPASASDTGTTGEICWDASYIYVCTATNTWKRAALSTW